MEQCAVLVIDDDESTRRLLQVVARKYCPVVHCASDGEAAASMLREHDYDVVILDLMLPKINGFELADLILALPRRPRLIVHSAVSRYFGDRFPPETIVLQKPLDIRRLDQALFAIQPPL